MKFIINATTVSNANEQLIKELRPIKHLFGGDWDEMVKAIRAETEVTLKHVSLTLQDNEWIVRVDDEIITKQIALIGKAMRLFAPILLTFKMIAKELDSDLRALASWLREE
ncbi:MAG: hypothetical protein KA203_01805 [Aquabacterium sp.]|nr:hypothetical protein [Aquabacterium sp.]